MTATIIDGLYVSKKIREKITKDCHEFSMRHGHLPKLHVFLVGNNQASQIYVQNKKKACESVGIKCEIYQFPTTTTEDELLSGLINSNINRNVHGILIQLPLPSHINLSTLIAHLSPLKDVDCFHPENVGLLVQNNPRFLPCTPKGIMHLLDFYNINVTGLDCLVLGVSQIVGRPMGLELLNRKATVTYCHSQTKDLETKIRQADIIISATGHRKVINPEWLNKNQSIIDVGILRDANNKITGDIDFELAKEKVAHITPVPGGVGPMTITSLLENILIAANIQSN